VCVSSARTQWYAVLDVHRLGLRSRCIGFGFLHCVASFLLFLLALAGFCFYSWLRWSSDLFANNQAKQVCADVTGAVDGAEFLLKDFRFT
jgi:hypothetical protein